MDRIHNISRQILIAVSLLFLLLHNIAHFLESTFQAGARFDGYTQNGELPRYKSFSKARKIPVFIEYRAFLWLPLLDSNQRHTD